jgi:hypothetical protein
MSIAKLVGIAMLLRETRLHLECRVAPLASLSFAELKGWEAIETIHLGIAGVFLACRVDYTTAD